MDTFSSIKSYIEIDIEICSGQTLISCQTPTQLLSHSPSLAGQGEKIRLKSSWVKIKRGRSLNSYHHGLKRLNIGIINLIYC